jgi:hypothetical protein
MEAPLGTCHLEVIGGITFLCGSTLFDTAEPDYIEEYERLGIDYESDPSWSSCQKRVNLDKNEVVSYTSFYSEEVEEDITQVLFEVEGGVITTVPLVCSQDEFEAALEDYYVSQTVKEGQKVK